MGTEFGVAPRRIRPSLDFGVDNNEIRSGHNSFVSKRSGQ